jgi:hypothetical protein
MGVEGNVDNDPWNEAQYGIAWLPMFAAQAGLSIEEMAKRSGIPWPFERQSSSFGPHETDCVDDLDIVGFGTYVSPGIT